MTAIRALALFLIFAGLAVGARAEAQSSAPSSVRDPKATEREIRVAALLRAAKAFDVTLPRFIAENIEKQLSSGNLEGVMNILTTFQVDPEVSKKIVNTFEAGWALAKNDAVATVARIRGSSPRELVERAQRGEQPENSLLLRHALTRGSLDAFKYVINGNPHWRLEQLQRMLFETISTGQVPATVDSAVRRAAVDELLKVFAAQRHDLAATTKNGLKTFDAVEDAVYSRDPEILLKVLKAGADPNAHPKDIAGPLGAGTKDADRAILRFLINNKTQVLWSASAQSILEVALDHANAPTIEIILNAYPELREFCQTMLARLRERAPLFSRDPQQKSRYEASLAAVEKECKEPTKREGRPKTPHRVAD